MRKSILSVIVCLFMLTCVGCEKNNYEKVPATDITMKAISQNDKNNSIVFNLEIPEDWTASSDEKYQMFAYNENKINNFEDQVTDWDSVLNEDILPLRIQVQNYYKIDGIDENEKDDLQAAYHELFNGNSNKYREYINKSAGVSIERVEYNKYLKAHEGETEEQIRYGFLDMIGMLTDNPNSENSQEKNYLTDFDCKYFKGKHGTIAQVKYSFEYDGKTYSGVYCIREDIPYMVLGGFDDSVELSSGDIALQAAYSLEITEN